MKSDLLALLASARKNWDAWLPLMDCLEEMQAPVRDLVRLRRYTKNEKSWAVTALEEELVYAGVITWDECPSQQEALAFHATVEAIDIDAVELMSIDRSMRRTELAARVRKLFTRLRLKGASVTSSCRIVEVRLPKRFDRQLEFGIATSLCPASMANHACRKKVQAILLRAFPNTEDRSTPETDYFDFVWAFS